MQRPLNPYLKAQKQARDALILEAKDNLFKLARRFCERLPASVEIGDLIGCGYEELVKLAARYDASCNDNFWGYAKSRCKGAMLDYLRSLDPLSRGDRKLVKDIQKVNDDYFDEFDEFPDDEYIAEKLNITKEQVEKARLSAAIELISPIEESEFGESNENYSQELLLEKIGKSLVKLNQNEQLILQLYFYEELTLQEISTVLKISLQRVQQIQKQALQKIRKDIENG